jgi:hypothetical protein
MDAASAAPTIASLFDFALTSKANTGFVMLPPGEALAGICGVFGFRS